MYTHYTAFKGGTSNLLMRIPFGSQSSQITVTTDAFLLGWGTHCLNRCVNDAWSRSEQGLHINL